MRKVFLILLLCFFSALLWPTLLWALALGPIKVHSYLDQPLDAEVPLRSLGSTSLDNIKVGLASKEAYDMNHIRYNDSVSNLQFKVGNNREGMSVLHIYTLDPVHDPYLNFILSFSWPNGFLNQQYTVLLDPPELKTQPRSAQAVVQSAILANQTPVPPGTYAEVYGPTANQDTLSSIPEVFINQALKQSNSILVYQLQQIQQQNQNLQGIIQQQENQINELRQELIQIQPTPLATVKPVVTPAVNIQTLSATQLSASPLKNLSPSQSRHSFPILLMLLALACLAGAVIFYLRWRKEHHFAQTKVNDFSSLAIELPTFKSTKQVNDAPPSPMEIVSEPVVADPLEEAEVYIAYERYKPAESVLLAALAKTPQRIELLDKLFELYTLMPNQVAYQNAMQEYREQIKVLDSNLWERILARHEVKWPTQVKKHESEFAPPASPAPVKPVESPKQPESGLKLAPLELAEDAPKEKDESSSLAGKTAPINPRMTGK